MCEESGKIQNHLYNSFFEGTTIMKTKFFMDLINKKISAFYLLSFIKGEFLKLTWQPFDTSCFGINVSI